MLKKSIIFFYLVAIVVMAVATIIEKYEGTLYVSSHIYGAWWFSLLWGMLTAAAIFYFLKRRIRRWSVVVLHLSFVLILLGALLTHLLAHRGMIHLRWGEQTTEYIILDKHSNMQERPLPFMLRLDSFKIIYHEGTRAAADYQSHLSIIDGEEQQHVTVSMNHIASHRSYRLYQSSYDEDGRGSVLSVNSDPWGIPVTYTGYGLLFLSLVWILIDPKGSYRQLWRNPLLKKGALLLLLLLTTHGTTVSAQPALPASTAEKFGQLSIVYNDRVCPLQTYALDFTKKLYGKTHYGDFTAEQVLTGFMFWGKEWNQQPVIRIKSGELKSALQLPDHASVNTFFNPTIGTYRLGTYIQDYYQGRANDGLHKQAAKIDDQLQLVMSLQQGSPLKLFPYTQDGTTQWYSPTDKIPESIPEEDRQFMQQSFSLLSEYVAEGNYAQVEFLLDKLLKYQQNHGGHSLQTPTAYQAERIYNRIPFATILFMVCLTMGFLSLGVNIWQLSRSSSTAVQPRRNLATRLSYVLLLLSFTALTVCLALRWVITAHVPMSNGYETMLLLSWFIQLITLFAYHRFAIMLTFGFLLSGFFLLVSHISQMDPQMTHMMPVLQSPLLSLHVSIIMMAFALLSLTFICGLTFLMIHAIKHLRHSASAAEPQESTEALQLLSRLFLYPALTTLGIGIFLGAIWANISWGQYWSWDPKEVWALITFMIYAIAVHVQSFPRLRKPLFYHTFMTLAFLTILMTYFGVNYFLGGMHSYA